MKHYEDGEPCEHPGCLHHVTHPCEGCGRIGGRSIVSRIKGWIPYTTPFEQRPERKIKEVYVEEIPEGAIRCKRWVNERGETATGIISDLPVECIGKFCEVILIPLNLGENF